MTARQKKGTQQGAIERHGDQDCFYRVGHRHPRREISGQHPQPFPGRTRLAKPGRRRESYPALDGAELRFSFIICIRLFHGSIIHALFRESNDAGSSARFQDISVALTASQSKKCAPRRLFAAAGSGFTRLFLLFQRSRRTKALRASHPGHHRPGWQHPAS